MIITRPINDSEPDLLIGFEQNDLIIKDLDSNVVATITSNKNGWTHDALETFDFDSYSPFGWVAYLGEEWIGSSEV